MPDLWKHSTVSIHTYPMSFSMGVSRGMCRGSRSNQTIRYGNMVCNISRFLSFEFCFLVFVSFSGIVAILASLGGGAFANSPAYTLLSRLCLAFLSRLLGRVDLPSFSPFLGPFVLVYPCLYFLLLQMVRYCFFEGLCVSHHRLDVFWNF